MKVTYWEINVKTVTPKQVMNWKWYPLSGTILTLEGKFYFTDRIQALWARYHKPDGKLGHGVSYQWKNRVQPWIFFHRSCKKYRVTLLPD